MERVYKRDQTHQEQLVIPQLSHDWGDPVYTWSDDYATCTATRICKRDSAHVETEVARSTEAPDSPRR